MGLLMMLGITAFPDMRVSSYRGVYRLPPNLLEFHPKYRIEEERLKELLQWYRHEHVFPGGTDLLDLPALQELLYMIQRKTEIAFEIVEVTEGEQPPQVGTEFLGFDISAGLHYHD